VSAVEDAMWLNMQLSCWQWSW